MRNNTGIFRAIFLATVTLAAQAGATEVQSTSYCSWIETVSGAPANCSMNLDSLELIDANGLEASEDTSLEFSVPYDGAFTLDQTTTEVPAVITAGFKTSVSAPATPSAEAAATAMIGSGLLFFGARRKVFSNISANRA